MSPSFLKAFFGIGLLSFKAFAVEISLQPHPRSLDMAVLSADRLRWERLAERVSMEAMGPIPAELGDKWALAAEGWRKHMAEIQSVSFGEEHRLLPLTLVGLALQDERLIGVAKSRALSLASWDPRGATGYFFHDQAAISVAWTLALVYDWLYEYLSAEEKRKLLSAIQPRVEDMLAPPVQGLPSGWAGLDFGRKLDRWPYDSHGAVALARLSVICAVLAGEGALFDQCVREVVPRYAARPVPWGGSDGGYANGTGYAQWDVGSTHFVVWHLLRSALGVDLWQHRWTRGYLNFLVYFLPPGAPVGLFGDGAEQAWPSVWATQAKAYAAALPSPLADWYASRWTGEDARHLALLLAPARDWNKVLTALPPGTPQAVHLTDIGWVAMHSDLADPKRTSVYFKSSPYGSYSHSHADQNSFVIHARGQPLAIDSGYYESFGYGSPHWRDWYTQTRAHNAITFDGGQGQVHNSMEAKGEVVHFEHHPDYDLVTGDATQAYGGALTKAMRSLVYLRPDMVLVYDSVASEVPRTWEWNLHALSKMKLKGPRELEIEQAGVRMCVMLLEAPKGAFSQTDRFTTEPQAEHPRQWHARFSTFAPWQEARFVALFDVGCGGVKASVSEQNRDFFVSLLGYQFGLLENGRVSVVAK